MSINFVVGGRTLLGAGNLKADLTQSLSSRSSQVVGH